MFTVPPDSNTVCVPLEHMDPAIITASFQQACQSRGLSIPDPMVGDGQFQRFSTNGKSSDKAGFYLLDLPTGTGLAGCWRSGIKISFEAVPANDTEANKTAREQEKQRQRTAHQALREQVQVEAQGTAQRLYNAASSDPATVAAHPYLVAKGVTGIAAQAGCRVQKNVLLIPLFDASGDLWSLQTIKPDGTKAFLPGARRTGLFWKIGDGSPVYLAEGPATALSIAAADQTAVCCFGKSNLLAVAKTFRDTQTVIVAADHDEPGLTAGRTVREVLGCALVYPPTAGQDFNDLHCTEGLDAVRAALVAAPSTPDPLRREPPPAEPYPVEALGPILGSAVRSLHRIIQAPDALIAQSLLAAAALCAQPHANAIIDGRVLPLSLFCLTVGASGERKSAVDTLALKPVQERQRELVEAFKADTLTHKAEVRLHEQTERELLKSKVVDLKAVKANRQAQQQAAAAMQEPPAPPLLPNLLVGEPTAEGLFKLFALGQPSLGLFSDEGALFVGGHALAKDSRLRTIGALSKLWDGKPLDRVRSLDGASVLYDRRLSLHLMVQPRIAAELLADEVYIDQGILSRILLAWPTSTAGTRRYVIEDPAQDPAVTRYWKTLTTLLTRPYPLRPETRNELQPRCIPLASAAKAAWIQYADTIETQLGDGGVLEPVRGLANKAAEHAARLAGVLAVIENPDCAEISLVQVQAGMGLMDYYLTEALRVQSVGIGDPVLRLAETALNWLHDAHLTEVYPVLIYQRGPHGIREADTARRVLAVLEKHRWLVKRPDGKEIDGAYRREVWEVVPKERPA